MVMIILLFSFYFSAEILLPELGQSSGFRELPWSRLGHLSLEAN
jgi:hypothetical protein